MFGFIRPTRSVIEIESSVLAAFLKFQAPLALWPSSSALALVDKVNFYISISQSPTAMILEHDLRRRNCMLNQLNY